MNHPETSPDAELLLRFARAGHEAGYPTADLEERVLALARAVGLEDAQISVTPTVIDVTVGSLRAQRSSHPAGSAECSRPRRHRDWTTSCRTFSENRLDTDGALTWLDALRGQPLRRPWPTLLAAYAVAGTALTPVLGGGWREAVTAALVGLIVRAVAIATRGVVRAEPVPLPIAAVSASFRRPRSQSSESTPHRIS